MIVDKTFKKVQIKRVRQTPFKFLSIRTYKSNVETISQISNLRTRVLANHILWEFGFHILYAFGYKIFCMYHIYRLHQLPLYRKHYIFSCLSSTVSVSEKQKFYSSNKIQITGLKVF